MKRKAREPLASCIQCRHGMGARLKGSSHWPFAYCHPSVRSQGIDEATEKWGLLDNDPCFRLLERPNHFQKPLFWSWIWLSCDHAFRLNVFACIPIKRLAKSFNTSWNVTNFVYQLDTGLAWGLWAWSSSVFAGSAAGTPVENQGDLENIRMEKW